MGLAQWAPRSTSSPLASVPEGGAPACESGATWRMRARAISATLARRTDRERFTWRRFLRQNAQRSVVQVQNTCANSNTQEAILQVLEHINAVMCGAWLECAFPPCAARAMHLPANEDQEINRVYRAMKPCGSAAGRLPIHAPPSSADPQGLEIPV